MITAWWLLMIGCFTSRTTESRDDGAPASALTAGADAGDAGGVNVEVDGLVVDLFDASAASGDGPAPIPRPPAKALDARSTAALLSRAPGIAALSTDERAFAVRAGPKPPPLPGTDTLEAFPPRTSGPAPAVTNGPPAVLRHQPDGEVPAAPSVSVTFDQPMVAVGAQGASRPVPATLTPASPGRWRWLGTRTLVFEPDGGRMPMATEYRVEIPAGTRSAAGAELAKATTFTFATPPLKLASSWPTSGPIGLDPVIALTFDQRIDREALLAHLMLVGGAPVALRLATAEEVARDEGAAALVRDVPAERVLALVPAAPLAPNTSYTVVLSAGAPSAEGPRVTSAAQTSSFYTYPPLTVTDSHCWHENPCPPTYPLVIELSNPLPDEVDLSQITVEPAIDGMSVSASGQQIVITGALVGRSTYTVTLPASLRDQFGQTLGHAEKRAFRIGPAERTLYSPGEQMVVLDPASAKLPVFTTNQGELKVTVHRATPELWGRWIAWMDGQWDGTGKGPMPGERVFDGPVRPEKALDRIVETGIDLTPYLKDGAGQFLVRVEPAKQPKNAWERQILLKWVQVTDIGLVAFVDGERLVGWASDLGDGAPLGATSLSLLEGGQATTGADGLATIPLPTTSRDVPNLLVAKRGTDTAILPESQYRWGGNTWLKVNDLDDLRWYLADDRGLYRPGETAHVKGWLRRSETGPTGDLQPIRSGGKVEFRLTDATGNQVGMGTAPISGLGGFALALPLPADMNLGHANLEITASGVGELDGLSTSYSLRVEEFRRPEFEVTAEGDADSHLLGDRAQVDLDAAYYAGGGLPNAEVQWSVYARPESYAPPGWADYTFGKWTPWWMSWSGEEEKLVESFTGHTDGGGAHHLGIHFRSVHPSRPMRVRAEGTVMDVNRQAWTASDTILLHPASRYVGLRAGAAFVEKGAPVEVQVALVDVDGKPVAGDADVVFARTEGRYARGAWEEQELDPQSCQARAGADGKAKCAFTTVRGGQYRVRATVRDDQGRANESETRIWVSGGELAPARQVELEQVTLVPERKDTAVGQTARILVQAPFFPAEAVMTVRRAGLLSTERFTMDGPTKTLSVPITDGMVPDITVQVDLVGKAPRVGDDGRPIEGATRPAHASGSITLPIAPLRRTLAVSVTPAAHATSPGAKTTVGVEVRDADGEPVPDAEVLLVIADESVLALTGYKLPDPLEIFYAGRGAGVRDARSRDLVALANPQQAAASGAAAEEKQEGRVGGGPRRRMSPKMMEMDAMPAAPMATMAFGGSAGDLAQPIAVRTDLSALALFAPDVRTDARGRATVPVQLPDNLTRYRIMAVAVDGERSFGSADGAITARLPLMVRPSAPRFLNTGDQLELPIVVQNQTDAAMTVDVAVRATNLAFVDKVSPTLPALGANGVSSAGRRVVVPANDRVEVRFPAAAKAAGTARIQVVASGKGGADAAQLEIPVWTPATSEAFATYGAIDGAGVVQPVQAPADAWPQFGGLTVTTSSTQLQALTDAVLYLQRYPYECSEQIASRLLAIAALRDVLAAFEADGLPPKEELDAQVQRDLERLAALQHYDGGFSFWRADDESWPMISIHVANAFARAKAKGYAVPERAWEQSQRYLRDLPLPAIYSREAKLFLRAYAVDVRRRMGDADPGAAKAVFAEGGDALPLDAIAFLLPTLADAKAPEADAIAKRIANQTNETAGTAHFVTSYTDGAQFLLHSDRRADGIVLEALLESGKGDADLVQKVVRGLLAHQTKGRWANTQENAFVLLALDRYFQVYEKETPDFVARVWLGAQYAGDHPFRGRTTERSHVDIPMEALGTSETKLTLARDGSAGRLYYRIGLDYAPKDLRLSPADYGFTVERTYQAVDDPSDVRQDADGTWHVRAGARVKVQLSMVADARRYHVALVDPLPAGLEALNPALATTGTLPIDAPADDPWWWWSRTWYEHENLRDERVEVFSSLLWEGVHEYSYVARATTPGRFVVPPPKAEEMYMPETFGRGGTDIVVVE